MIHLDKVTMEYVLPRSFQATLRQPFAPAQTVRAVHETTLSIDAGNRIAVLGPNGAGKTTLLKLISGLLLPTSGTVEVCGHNTARHNTKARASVGMVMNEERSFFWRLTGRQNLQFFGTLDNLLGADRDEKIAHLLDLVGLTQAADKPVSGYSSGMKQRLAMARGLLSDPQILIMDEPTRTLDPIACDEMVELILNRLSDATKILLIATHRLEEAERLCNRLLAIRSGSIQEFDTIAKIIKRHASLLAFYRQCMSTSSSPNT